MDQVDNFAHLTSDKSVGRGLAILPWNNDMICHYCRYETFDTKNTNSNVIEKNTCFAFDYELIWTLMVRLLPGLICLLLQDCYILCLKWFILYIVYFPTFSLKLGLLCVIGRQWMVLYFYYMLSPFNLGLKGKFIFPIVHQNSFSLYAIPKPLELKRFYLLVPVVFYVLFLFFTFTLFSTASGIAHDKNNL